MVKEFWRQAALQEGRFFTGKKFMWRRPCESNAVGCSSRADAVDFFAAYTTAMTQWFSIGWITPNICPFFLRDLNPHLIIVPLAHQSQSPKQHLDPFIRVAQLTNVTNRQTDRQTDRPRYSVCSNRPHLATAALWPDNKYSIDIVPSSPGIHRLHMI